MPVTSRFMRGATRSPRHKIAAAHPHIPIKDIPLSYFIVPKTLQMWGNATYGDCVSAEEAANLALNSVKLGLSELLITDNEVIQWARQGHFLNGANLTDVMDAMIQSGLVGPDNKTYNDAPNYKSVDWTNATVLQSAIFQNPVKIAVAANQLENAVNSTNGQTGWFLTGGYRDQNTDHCVNLNGYGTAADFAKAFNVSIPSNVSPNTPGYALFTWQTIGFIDVQTMVGFTDEAWVRQVSPQFPPSPTPVPVPPVTADPVFNSAAKIITLNGWKSKQLAANMPLEFYTNSKIAGVPSGWTTQ